MERLLKEKTLAKMVIAVAILAFATVAYSSELNLARIMPTGTVSVFQGDQKVGEFSKEAPLPEGCLLSCKGKCGVKMDHLYFVATDGSRFSVIGKEDVRVLNIEKGTIYFILSALPKTLVFKTPHGTFTTDAVMLNVSTDGGFLQGYVSVTQEDTELGVIEGGSMSVSTVKGEKMIQPGNRIILAQATMGSGGEGDSGLNNRRLLYSLIPVGVVAGAIIYKVTKDDNKEGSPFTP